jgi:broad specificity phosphatase PhoE
VRTTVYLLRHGAPVGSETRRFIGHLDVALSAAGLGQASALARRLTPVPLAAVYTSDLARTRRTAEVIAAPHGVAPVALAALREFAMGQWEGLTAEEIERRDPGAFRAWMSGIADFQFPGGENLVEVTARAWEAFERIVEAHAGAAIAIVGHGGTNRSLLCRALGVRLDRILSLGQDYGALSVLERNGERWLLRLLNHQEPP